MEKKETAKNALPLNPTHKGHAPDPLRSRLHKNAGIVRHIGLSSHSPKPVNRVLDLNIINVVMFGVNLGYDYGEVEFSIGNTSERQELYCRCQREGVGITAK